MPLPPHAPARHGMGHAATDGMGHAARRPPPYALMLAAIVVTCASIIGLDAWRTWAARDARIATAQIETANLARSLAQHAHDTLGTADTLLISLREAIEANGTGPTHLANLRHLLASQIATVPMMRDLMMFDAAASRLVDSGGPAPQNVLDRAYFQYHAAHNDRSVHVGQPVQGRPDGAWIITLSRRVNGPAGEFAGVVVATFSIKVIRQFYEAFDVGKQGFIGLNALDGTIITRHPAAGSRVGSTISGQFAYSTPMPDAPTGDWRSVSPADGMEHLGSYRVVDAFPLVLVVGYGVDELLAPWRIDALFHLAITLLTSAAIATLGIRHVQHLRHQFDAGQEIERKERQYRLLADNSTDLIIQADTLLHIVYASPASHTLLKMDPDQLVNLPLHQLAPSDDWPGLAASLAIAAERGTAPAVQHRLAGRDLWAETSARRLPSCDGYILVIRDITARRQAENQLRQVQRMETVGKLTAGVAHDFNNLLQTQSGALELLLKDVAERPKATRYANLALGATARAAKLTHSLLSFSRQQVLDPAPVQLPALFERIEPILARTLGPRITLSFEPEPGLVPPFADAAQLETALLNLALNARDAMPEGGRFSIQARNAPATPDHPGHGTDVVITVSDTGTGMSPATLAQACDPFFTTKGIGGGSGLGLSMVHGFVRQSGGTLHIDSVLGEGTQVKLRLPAASPNLVAPTTPGLSRRRILLVDDAAEILAAMADMLESVGHTVTPVTTGEAALAVLAAGAELDALVTDLDMPGLDGGELARRAAALRPSLPIVITTGSVATEHLRMLPPGTAIVHKPVTGETLAARIAQLLQPQSPPLGSIPAA